MVQGFLGSFKRACPQGIKFDAITVKTICTSLAILGCSQIFLAYSPAPLWQCQTGNEEICSEKSKSDGWRKVRIPFTHWAAQLKVQCIPSREIALTNMHISMLKRTIPKFRAANPNCWEKIVKEAADHIKGTWTEDVEFDRDAVINVCDISAKLDRSQMFLAYLRILVWKSKKGREEIHFQNSKLVIL